MELVEPLPFGVAAAIAFFIATAIASSTGTFVRVVVAGLALAAAYWVAAAWAGDPVAVASERREWSEWGGYCALLFGLWCLGAYVGYAARWARA